MYNRVILAGNLTRDIELRYSQSGMAIAKTAIATSRKFTSNGEKKEEVMFIDITFFGRSAEVANQYLRKGSKILVEGRLQFDQWVDQNGGKRSKHAITVDSMQMLDSKGDNQNSGGAQGSYTAPQQQQSQDGYNAPQQQQQSQSSYNAPQQQQSYQQPSYGGQQQQQQKAPAQQSMPADLPSIDIDEDEIPF
ncbi:MAG: single-stranded DNA-binding protein [Campylobacterota bacterium]